MVVINIDWLSFSVLLALSEEEKATGARLQCPNGCSLVECTGTNLYKRRVLVLSDGGEKLLTLLLEPYSPVLDKRSMFVEVANRWLYCKLDWVIPMLDELHLHSFQSLSRLDVCGDFTPDIRQVHIIDSLMDNDMYITGKGEGMMFHDFVYNADGGRVGRVARQLSWGSKKSNIHWKLYNKTLEIHETDGRGRQWCTKPYIRDAWEAAGIDPKNVWRLEVSIMGSAKYKWRGDKLDWSFVMDRDSVVDFFMDIVDTRFIVRANEGHKCRKWDEVHQLFEWDNAEVFRCRQRLVGKEQYHTDHAATMRAAMQQLERPEVKYCQDMAEIWLSALKETIREAHLEAYFYRAVGMTFEDWEKDYIKAWHGF